MVAASQSPRQNRGSAQESQQSSGSSGQETQGHWTRFGLDENEPGAIMRASAQDVHRVLVLFERHRLGLTQHEICGFTSLSSPQAGACLAQLALAGMISSEPYARGRLWHLCAAAGENDIVPRRPALVTSTSLLRRGKSRKWRNIRKPKPRRQKNAGRGVRGVRRLIPSNKPVYVVTPSRKQAERRHGPSRNLAATGVARCSNCARRNASGRGAGSFPVAYGTLGEKARETALRSDPANQTFTCNKALR